MICEGMIYYDPPDTLSPVLLPAAAPGASCPPLGVVREVAFHPERPLAVSAADDGMVKVWNLARVKRPGDLRSAILQDPVRTCYSHTGAALCVAAEANGGDFFASGGVDGIIRL